MRLSDKYRPTTLSEVVGQMPVRLLRAFAADPYPTCFLFEGPAGCGKTSAAYALANDVGADEFYGVETIVASELTVDAVRELRKRLWMRPMMGKWKVLVIEELELLHPQAQTLLKVLLETELPPHAIVVATSNGALKLQKALLQRFTTMIFSAGDMFASAVQERLAEIWQAECGDDEPLPPGMSDWGWDGDEFSMRTALDAMQRRVLTRDSLAAVGA